MRQPLPGPQESLPGTAPDKTKLVDPQHALEGDTAGRPGAFTAGTLKSCHTCQEGLPKVSFGNQQWRQRDDKQRKCKAAKSLDSPA
jgi:hypothetical protein